MSICQSSRFSALKIEIPGGRCSCIFMSSLLSRLLANILATRLVKGDQTVELRILGFWERGAGVSGARGVEVVWKCMTF